MRSRKIFVRPQSAMSSDINVTPLVDVVLVLLIIFMVMTPLQVQDIGVHLPEVSEGADPSSSPAGQVVVGITVEGRLTVNNQPVADEDYIPQLKGHLAAMPPGQKLLFFMPDAQARYERLILALSGAKQAGAETLGMMAQGASGTPRAP
jgi:biopolymer transport protein TolR